MTGPLNAKLNRLTETILNSYEADDRTQRVGKMMQPSHPAIVEVLDLTRQLLLPGYFGHKKLTRENIRYHLGNLLVNLGEKVADQIYHCMCMDQACSTCTHESDCRKKAQTLTSRFLQRVPCIRDALALDAQAAYDGDPAAKSVDEVIYCYPGFYAVTVYRIAHELLTLGVPLMPRIMSEHAHSLTGTDIHPGAKIGKSFFIDHATGVVIGETTTIGNNVKIYQGVTLGALSFPKDERGRVIKGHKRHPTLKDNVTVYANATILGGDTVIARGVTVGGNTFVTQSVNADSLVAIEAPKLNIKRKRRK